MPVDRKKEYFRCSGRRPVQSRTKRLLVCLVTPYAATIGAASPLRSRERERCSALARVSRIGRLAISSLLNTTPALLSAGLLLGGDEVELFLHHAGGHELHPDGVPELEGLAGAAAHKAVMLLVVFEIIIPPRADVNQPIGVGLVKLDIEPAVGDTRDDGVKLLADAWGEKLNLLHLDAVALGVGGRHFALGGVEGERVELLHLLFRNRHTATMCLNESMDDEVGVAADRRGEVGVEVEGETEVADILGGVDGLAHRA